MVCKRRYLRSEVRDKSPSSSSSSVTILAQGQACNHVCRGGLPGPWFARVSGRACASAPVLALFEPRFHTIAAMLGLHFLAVSLLSCQHWCVPGAPKAGARYGTCARRGCARNAQSGYANAQGDRFCKPCFAECYPRLHAAKQTSRRGA